MDDRIADDALFALKAKVRQARAMSPEDRMAAGPRLFAGVCERMKEGLRDEHPDTDEGAIHQLLLKRLAKLRKIETHRFAQR